MSRISPIAALPGYEVTMFAQADSRLIVSGPDSIAVDGDHVFIDYQNVTAKDCADADKASSTVVEYDLKGKILNINTGVSVSVPLLPSAIWATQPRLISSTATSRPA